MSSEEGKKRHRGVTVLAALIIIGVVAVVAFLIVLDRMPAVPDDYTETVPTGGDVEAKYLGYGPYGTVRADVDAGAYGTTVICYPDTLPDSEGSSPWSSSPTGPGST